MRTVIQRLFLAAPLFYFKEKRDLDFPAEDAAAALTVEKLYCFELNPSQVLEFEPDKDSFIKSLVYSGKAMSDNNNESENVPLPSGNYLFSQKEGRLNKGEILDLAVELQKEGLWQRLEPGNCLYVRFLAEDGRDVTQVFRPYSLKTLKS